MNNVSSLDAMRGPQAHFGTWISVGSAVIAELAGECGFDWLLIDLEHGCDGESALPGQLRALRGSPSAAIVRVGAPHPDLIGRALDWGASGIMVPHVSSVEDAQHCVQAMQYPPRGKRGVSRSCRAYGYGLRVPSGVNDMPVPFFMAQIENIEGVERAPEIAAVEGVDVLFVGPADMQFDLQARAELASRSYEECLARVVSAARSAGKQSGILLRDAGEVQRYLDLGFTHIAIDSDLFVLRKGFQQTLKVVRELSAKE